MKLERSVQLNGKDIKLDYRYDCSMNSVVYLALCKLCKDQEPQNSNNFYFGQTVNTLMSKCNGHREKFKMEKFDQSALSMHVMDKHPAYFGDKLNNFDFGVVKAVDAMQLDRVEDCFIYVTKADSVGLNRYKVSK